MIAHTPALDGLRGIAIILVLFHHFTIIEPVSTLDRAITSLTIVGWSGVDLFFVLSGFLITGILIDARGSPRYFSSFYARRTLRIFPLYYLVAFLALVVLPLFPRWHRILVGDYEETQWPYWTYLMNFAIAEENQFEHGVLDVAWSLAIEEQFYVLWAAVVWLWPPRLLGALCGTVMAAAPVARTLALAEGAEPIDVYVLTPYRADALATGGLLAWAIRQRWMRGRVLTASLAAIIGLTGTAAVCWIDGDTWWWEPSIQRWGYSLLALAAGGMLLAAVTLPSQHMWPRLLTAGWLRAFGKYSYCLYLIHLPVMRMVRTFVLGPEEFAIAGSPWLGQLAFYALATAPAVAIAWLSWHAFEGPIMRLKRFFPY